MKKTIITLLLLCALFSCKKEMEPTPPHVNTIAEDIKNVIAGSGVQALMIAYEGSTTVQSFGWGTDYSFPGDNFVRVQNQTYNLNHLIRYYIYSQVSGTTKELRLVLVFPKI